MNIFLRKWLTISFFNFLLVASLGVIMRYKITFYLPFIQQKYVLHSHSNFAFTGWVTQTIMVLLVHNLSLKYGEWILKKYVRILYANLITSYGLLISFFIQGYSPVSISLTVLSIIVSYFFAVNYWKDLEKIKSKNISNSWFKAALVFNVVSSIGAFGLGYIITNKIVEQNWYLASTYFFLHFQYNGWFFFACMGLLISKLENIEKAIKPLKIAFLLFCYACIPAYCLSILWFPFPPVMYFIMLTAVIAQLVGWALTIKEIIKNKFFIIEQFSKYGRILLLLSAIAFTIKLLLQSGSIHPVLSQLSYGFRPIIIGYLHLVLLAVTSIFIIGYIVSFNLVPVTIKLITGIFILVSGIIINEILLMVQGVAGLNYNTIPYINLMLFITALILFIGISIIFISLIKKPLRQ